MEWFLGEIRIFSFDFNTTQPQWLPCDGRTLQIARYQGLFGLIGTTFGGDGKLTFGIPDLRGRAIVGANGAAGTGSTYPVGSKGGTPTVTLTQSQLPEHRHYLNVSTDPGTTQALPGSIYAQVKNPQAVPLYSTMDPIPTQIDPDTVKPAGGGLPHQNMQPSTALGYFIAVVGLWPPRPY